jgi:hypothetical protein
LRAGNGAAVRASHGKLLLGKSNVSFSEAPFSNFSCHEFFLKLNTMKRREEKEWNLLLKINR